MSFKREGNDISLLNRLKKHRVAEMLGSYIPEDEAKLLSNGRLTCLICNHRPIFDTTEMLAKHRRGKKHLFELNKYIQKNEQLELLKIKREQQMQAEACKKEELAQLRYNSQLLGPKEKSEFTPGNRKKIIDVPEIVNNTTPEATCESLESSMTSTPFPTPSSSSQLRKYLKKIKTKPSLIRLLDKEKSGYSIRKNDSRSHFKTSMILPNVDKHIEIKDRQMDVHSCEVQSDFSRNLSGWIKDKSGNWIKDPEAEFDSDEDEDLLG